ncbi:hypothetical protein [Treponema bryantii]|uniref:hypothetical protein n=1 Tax=Treponema bryantii TaxID=163 RepID=UPI0003B3FB9F|nr:hypothetical protein [Treponema bryantii]
MKKINLILGACAIAAAALLVSCNNGTKDYVKVNTIYNNYTYNVTGSVTNTSKSGTTAATDVTVIKETIKTALGDVNWSDDKVNGSNYDKYSVTISGAANWTRSYTAAGATSATETKWNDGFGVEGTEVKQERVALPFGRYSPAFMTQFNNIWNSNTRDNPLSYSDYQSLPLALSLSSNYVDDATYQADSSSYPNYSSVLGGMSYNFYVEEPCINPLELTFYEFDGDYYYEINDEYVKLPEDAFDGDFGDDEFTIKFSTTNNTRKNMSQAQKDDTTYVGSSETAIELTFKLVEAE